MPEDLIPFTARAKSRGAGVRRIPVRKCKACKVSFTPYRPMQEACSLECAIVVGKAKAERQQREVKRADRKQTKAALEKLKTRAAWLREAQAAFNAFIRQRDYLRPCICCGQPLGDGGVGGGYDCGHYRSTGSAPHLRFDERNAHAQRKHCNRWRGGRAIDYRIGLIKRIGLQAVEELEADQTAKKHTIEELRGVRDLYRAKLRELKGRL